MLIMMKENIALKRVQDKIERLKTGVDDFAARKSLMTAIGRGVWAVCRMVLMVGLSFIILYPIIYTVIIAFRPSQDLLDPSVVWLSKSLTLDNLKNAIRLMNFYESLPNTVLVVLVSTVLQMFSAALTGYGFARFKFKGKKLLFGLLLFTILVPPITIIDPLYMEFRFFDFFGIGSLTELFGLPLKVNLLNTRWTFYVPAMFANGLRSGLVIYIYNQFFKGLPKELEDAASIDGCGSMKIFFHIILPSATPVLVTIFIFSIVWYWNDYLFSSMFMPSLKTLSVALNGLGDLLRSELNSYDPYLLITTMQAGCLLVVTPILIVYLFLQKFFTESIEKTGIVG